MATFGPPLRDSASQYGNIYDNPEQRFGVQNAQAERNNTNQTLTSRPSEDGRRRRPVPQFDTDSAQSNSYIQSKRNQKIANRYYDDTQPVTNSQPRNKQKVKTTLAARTRGVTFATITGSIALTLWPFQFLLGALGAVMFGIANQSQESWLAWAADQTTQFGAWVIGYEYPDFMALAALGFFISVVFGWVSLGGSALLAVLMRLHPLGGNGAALKTGLFILAIVCYMIPLVNIFPWVLFWIWAVAVYPK